MVIKCPNCGNWTEDTSKFCPVCGTALAAPEAAAADSPSKPFAAQAAQTAFNQAVEPQLQNTFESKPGIDQGNVFEAGPSAPQSGQIPHGGSAPQSGQIPYGGSAPQGGQIPYGGNAPQGGKVPYGGVPGGAPYGGAPTPPKKKGNKTLFIILGIVAVVVILIAVLVVSVVKRIADMVESGQPIEEFVMPDSDEPEDIEDVPDIFDEDEAIDEDIDDIDDNDDDLGDISIRKPDSTELRNAGFDYLTSIPDIPADQVLYDEGGIRITSKGLGLDEYDELALGVLIENDTDKNITVDISKAAINTYVLDPIFYKDVEPHSKKLEVLEFYTSDINDIGLTNIGELDLYCSILDVDVYEMIAEPVVRIETSDYAVMDTPAPPEGFQLVNSDGVLILALGISDPDSYSQDQEMQFYCRNETDKDLTLVINDVVVNDVPFDKVSAYIEMPAGTKAYRSMFIWGDNLKENGLTQTDTIKFSISAYDSLTNDMVYDYGTADLVVTYSED